MEAEAHTRRQLAAIMFSDIVGYTAMMGRDELAAMHALKGHRDHLRDILPRFNGRLLGEIGDGTLSSFQSAVDAVNCALELQSELASVPEFRLRVGIHVGDVLFTDDNVYGDGVNVASRIHALATPGAICISATVYDDIRNQPELRTKALRDLGEQHLKNVSRPIRVYVLTPDAMMAKPHRALAIRMPARAMLSAAVVLVIGAIAFAVVKWKPAIMSLSSSSSTPPPQTQPAAHEIRSIAVLPLDNFSGDSAQEYFVDGMTDELTTDLAKISALRVISRGSVMQYKGAHRPATPQIARALNVDAILEGSVMRAGDKVRITAQLIDAPNDKHLWADSFERDSRDVLAMQDELALAIARQINIALTPVEQARLSKRYEVNPAALDAYLKGMAALTKVTAEGFQQATEYFNESITIDPNFARGYAGLGSVYLTAADLTMSNQVAMPKARELLAKAQQLDDDIADVHSWLGDIDATYDYDWSAAEAEHRRAVELEPGSSIAHLLYGDMLTALTRYDEAEQQLRLGQLLDPMSPYPHLDLGQLYNAKRDYPKALREFSAALQIQPNWWVANFHRGITYSRMGHYRESYKELEKAVALAPLPGSIAVLGTTYARSGRTADARKELDRLNHLPPQLYVAPCYPAWIHLALGEKDIGFALLDKAYEERSGCLQNLLSVTEYDEFRSDPRFIKLTKEVGLAK
jgi:adenylate cyclase